MNCRDAANRLYEYLDGDMTPEVTAAVRAHLADCRRCFSHFSFEETFLRFLRARTEARSAPPELKRRILDEILLDPDAGP